MNINVPKERNFKKFFKYFKKRNSAIKTKELFIHTKNLAES